jgi:hypothetical protein
MKENFMLLIGLAALFALVWKTPRGLAYAVPVAAVQLTTLVLLEKGAMNGLTNPHSWWFIWPIVWNFLVLGLAFVALPNGRSMAVATFLAELGVSFYAYMPIVSDLRNPPMNWGYPRTWEGFKHAITRGQYEQIKMGDILSKHFLNELWFYVKDLRTQFTVVLMAVALAAFPLGHLFTKKEHRRTWYSWLAAIGSCFLVMSVLLIALANTKGDVQDGFIQKVKFISSHGMFVLWIGYGLVFGAKFSVLLWNEFFNSTPNSQPSTLPKWLVPVLCALMLATSLIPIYENYTNDRLVFELGSAEQNGHTFGWQFGAWQLDGAEEIRDELLEDEEPLPNPLWPESMEPHSIFFGGTDPGRFVPTYMIYSADFRPDVYLITQNALADDTYMSVERDLYGDEIWIPSKNDSAEAFNQYVQSLSPEERMAKGVVMANGRVQVTGALSVMEINGILTKMMFDHERLRHAFYVEESYVIQWMYEYLTPHGLIMKINADKNPLTDAIVRNDMEFWDWYTRRLLKDPAFRRDFPAQKSFSKLRAAIAGLYANTRNRSRDDKTFNKYNDIAAQAFREAVALYPASPEASFRYIQDVLGVEEKWNAIIDIVSYTDRVDPNNARTKVIRDGAITIRDKTRALQANEIKDEDALVEACLDLCEACLALNPRTAYRYAMRLQEMPAVKRSFDRLWRLAMVFQRFGLDQHAARNVKEALILFPSEANDFEKRDKTIGIFHRAKQKEECVKAIQGAVELPDAQKIDVLLRYATILDGLGNREQTINVANKALKVIDSAKPSEVLSLARIIMKVNAGEYAPYVARSLLDPLMKRTDTSWSDIQHMAEMYFICSTRTLSAADAAEFQRKACDCYSQFAKAVDDKDVYMRLAYMYANAQQPASDDRQRQEAINDAVKHSVECNLKQAYQRILAQPPNLDEACALTKEALKAGSEYLRATYAVEAGQKQETPAVDSRSVKRLLLLSCLNKE